MHLRRYLGLSALSFSFLFAASFAAAKPAPKADPAFESLHTFAEIFALVQENYVEEVDADVLMQDALNGVLEGLDPHSHYAPQKEFDDRQKNARREYGGLGIEVSMENELVKVNYVIQDGPADKAGIKAGDYITAVAGEKTRGKTLGDAVEGMRGLEGDPIDVTVLSEGSEPRDVTVIREVVQGRVVRHRVEDGLGYIYIESFSHPRLAKDVEFALNDLKASLNGRLPGLVIDLRGNLGGRVDQTVAVASYFLDGGEVFSARGRTLANTQRFNALPGEFTAGVPIAVIINSRSASAAEILAGAIQDRGRGMVIGRRSFGKGSVQSVMQLSNGNGALNLTTQRYYTPSGKSIQGRGIMPDMLVAFRPDNGDTRKRFREDSLPNALQNPDETDFDEDLEALDYPPEDWPETEDYQLKKAVELIKNPLYMSMLKDLDKQP